MYHLTGHPHVARVVGQSLGQLPLNRLAAAPILRAALELMDRWVTSGKAPPPSRLPSKAEGSLVKPEEALAHFPRPSGVNLPASPSRLPLYDYGPDFERGILSEHPPKETGKEYQVYVSQVDSDGNELGGLRAPDIEAPLGTYTGWSLRKPGFAEGELWSLSGSFIPFARTRAEREAAGDPRRSIEERYADHAAYVEAVHRSVQALLADGLLLEEDAVRYMSAARARNPLDPSVELRPLLVD
jgi:hypothetical protein